MTNYNTIAESNNFIVLEQYSKKPKVSESYQSEYDLEGELIQDLVNQGYEYLPSVTNPKTLLANVREQLEILNNIQFIESEWQRFVETYLDKPGDSIIDKTRKIHDNHIHDRSTYNDIRDWLRREKAGSETEESAIDWGDVVFEVDLLKSQEINLDYILELIFEQNKKNKNKGELIEEVRRLIRASLGNRAKESLIVDFINQTNLDEMADKASIIDAFFKFAQAEQAREADELIRSEGLNEEAAKRYISASLKREFASENGTDLNATLPKMSPLNPQYKAKKQSVFQKIAAFVEKFKGVGGQF